MRGRALPVTGGDRCAAGDHGKIDAAQTSHIVDKNQPVDALADGAATFRHPGVGFVRSRYAIAIEKGDDQHAEACRQVLDRMLNGPRS